MSKNLHLNIVDKLPKLRWYALRLTGNDSDADDLVQDCMERSLARTGQYESGTNLQAWLMTIMRSIFINKKRRQAVANDYCRNRNHTLEQTTAPSQLDHLELKETLMALRQLSPDHRAAIYLLGIRQHTHKEAAQVMGTSVSTAKTRLFRARKRLREQLAA